jgi:exodeoxyribonuclease VII large subunit
MNNLEDALKPDVLIIARGGGSLEDLFAFNDEALVRAAFASHIPIISAIGHETDYTLLDFVADLRAPTPTAAAELTTPVLSQLVMRLQEMQLRISQVADSYLETLNLRLSRFDQILKDPLRYVFEKQQKIDDWSERLHLASHRFVVQKRLQLGHMKLSAPTGKLDLGRERLMQQDLRMQQSYKRYVEVRHDKLLHLTQQLENISFKKTLERGFCLAESEQGKILRSKDDVKPGKPFNLHFKDGLTKVRAVPSENDQGRLF